jgi:hypothetical protein
VKTIYGKAVNKDTKPDYSVSMESAMAKRSGHAGLDSLAKAEGLRKLMLAYALGMEQAALHKFLHDDADLRELIGDEIGLLATAA